MSYVWPGLLFNPSGTETGMFLDNKVDTMAADVPVPNVARSSATVVLIMLNEWALGFHDKWFQIRMQIFCWEVTEI